MVIGNPATHQPTKIINLLFVYDVKLDAEGIKLFQNLDLPLLIKQFQFRSVDERVGVFLTPLATKTEIETRQLLFTPQDVG